MFISNIRFMPWLKNLHNYALMNEERVGYREAEGMLCSHKTNNIFACVSM